MSGLFSHDIESNNGHLADPPINSGEVAAFGEFLRSARECRGVTLEQISRETKIPRRHLEALEHGQLAAVPGRTYQRGEIVAYATAVGLDRNDALHRLERASQTFEPQVSPVPANSARARVRAMTVVVTALLAAVAVLSSVIWSRNQGVSPAAQRATSTADQSPPAALAAQVSTASPARVAPAAELGAAIDTAAPETSPSRVRSAAPATQTSPTEVAQASEGVLVITSDPPGARVTVNGIGWGTTPVTIRHLPPGAKQIRLTKSGYSAATRAVRLVDGKTTTVSVPLPSSDTPPGR